MVKKLLLWHPETADRVVVCRGWLKRMLYPSAFATLGEVLKSAQIDLTDSDLFILHINRHLRHGDDVICTICGKTFKEITKKGAAMTTR